jgi:hypothetical protein
LEYKGQLGTIETIENNADTLPSVTSVMLVALIFIRNGPTSVELSLLLSFPSRKRTIAITKRSYRVRFQVSCKTEHNKL